MTAKSLEKLLEELHAPSPLEREATAWTPGKIGDHRAVKPLILTLQHDKDSGVRSAAARALGNLGDEQVVAPLCQIFLHNNDSEVRKTVVKALCN